MKRTIDHALLDNAKINKKDEFYTILSDIENEIVHYTHLFHGKIVYCNCDNPQYSNFWKYFYDHFVDLELKGLIATYYDSESICWKYDGKEITKNKLQGNGDFRSEECKKILQLSDIVVTNPPFSLFREYIRQLTDFEKEFLIISNINAITYKEVFALIQKNKIWLGINFGRGISGFIVPQDYELYGLETEIRETGERIISPNNCMWLTNLDNEKRHEPIELVKNYEGNEKEYPFYDNYQGINVNKTKDIPADFTGVMGVPITFLNKFNPDQFEIIKFRKGDDDRDLRINGKSTYFRILIKNKRIQHPAVEIPVMQPSLF
ncbi:MAG: adenosine deaminase [Flexilinea sp.]|nr:adenosine deaminase [Flexilinea sp.]